MKVDMINFNKHITKTMLNEYAGSEKKKTVIMDDGYKYLLKFPDPTREKDNTLSYINNAISEYIACNIFKSVGIPVQKTILGEYTESNGRKKIACACKDVRQPGEMMYEINKLELSSLDNTHARNLSFEYMEEVFEKMSNTISSISKAQLRDFYYDMFIVDALIGNTDRHNGNWAILESSSGIRISPVYDCGSSLAPLVDEKLLSEDMGSRCAMNATSVLNDKDNKRIKYCNFFESKNDVYMKEALKRIVPKINMDDIDKIILNTPYISDERKSFYKSFVHTSYEKILLPALDKTLSPSININNNTQRKCYDFYKSIVEPIKLNASYDKFYLLEATTKKHEKILQKLKMPNLTFHSLNEHCILN